jgi:hypothetical protein
MLKKLLQKAAPAAPPSLDEELASASQRAEKLLRGTGLDPTDPPRAIDAFIERRSKDPQAAASADLLSDLAALLGGHVRSTVGGQWGDDPLFGLSILQPRTLPHAVIGPLQAIRKKWQLGEGLKLANLVANLPSHLNAQARRPESPPLVIPQSGMDESAFAASCAKQACTFIARDLGVDIPMTLVGLRHAERWLRGQFLVRTVPLADLHRLGFLLGEVMRGLYGGKWSFDQARQTADLADTALIQPELPFYPLGRVMKMMLEQPEGNGLDEYVRLVPAARKGMKDES